MLIDNETLKQIDEIIDRAYTNFAYSVAGEDVLTADQKVLIGSLGLIIGRRPLIEILYLLVRQFNSPLYRKDKTLEQLITEITNSGTFEFYTPQSRYTLEHAKASVKQAIDSSKEELKKKVKFEVLKANIELKDKQTAAINVPGELKKIEESSNKLLSTLSKAALVAGVVGVFRKEFTSAMTSLINNVITDQITEQAIIDRLEPGQTKVYKEVIRDDRLSPECRRLHTHPDWSPRIYTLKELQENGTNIGKPKSQWKAVIGGTHPNCRCTLRPVPKS